MAQVKVYYDSIGKTLTVWFDDPNKEEVSEEIGNEIVLIKDKAGNTIGFERLNFDMKKDKESFSIEAIAV